MGFKDGKTMKWSWEPKIKASGGGGGGGGEMAREGGEKDVGKRQQQQQEEAKVRDVVEEVARHYRGLHRKEELAG